MLPIDTCWMERSNATDARSATVTTEVGFTPMAHRMAARIMTEITLIQMGATWAMAAAMAVTAGAIESPL